MFAIVNFWSTIVQINLDDYVIRITTLFIG